MDIPKNNDNLGLTLKGIIVFCIFHILLAWAILYIPEAARIHALAVLLLGCWFSLRGDDLYLSCVLGYIMGAEVLWRMSGDPVSWEFAKQQIVLLLVFNLLTHGVRKLDLRILFYFLLLIPATVLVNYGSFSEWKDSVSFLMTPHLALFLCALYFSGKSFSRQELLKIFICIIAPVITTGLIVYVNFRGFSYIYWTVKSNYAASGGFGPNQVSGILGIGSFLSVVIMFLIRKKSFLKLVFLFLALAFFSQAVFTFSRGGPLNAAASVAAFLLIIVKRYKKIFLPVVFLSLFVFSFIFYYMIPKIDKYTEGKLTERYADTEDIGDTSVLDTGGRSQLVFLDLELFKKNPLGVGLGASPTERGDYLRGRIASHTEWSRILAEHGILGLFSMLLLLSWIVSRYRLKHGAYARGISFGLIVFSLLYISHSAMRTIAPALFIGFLAADFNIED